MSTQTATSGGVLMRNLSILSPEFERQERIESLEQSRMFIQSILLQNREDGEVKREFERKLEHIDNELEALMEPMFTLYYLRINRRIYMSQSVTEITGFAILYGLLGRVEDMGLVNWNFEGIKCIEQ